MRHDHQLEDWMVESPFPNGMPDSWEDEDGGALYKTRLKKKRHEV